MLPREEPIRPGGGRKRRGRIKRIGTRLLTPPGLPSNECWFPCSFHSISYGRLPFRSYPSVSSKKKHHFAGVSSELFFVLFRPIHTLGSRFRAHATVGTIWSVNVNSRFWSTKFVPVRSDMCTHCPCQIHSTENNGRRKFWRIGNNKTPEEANVPMPQGSVGGWAAHLGGVFYSTS